ncbi:MAG: 50S ribosomal protein L11 methyltransferase [Acidobacteria bacterium]|nr:50S ribosomal protein L11 methyltransferase [Acidobacteriota bacterium]
MNPGARSATFRVEGASSRIEELLGEIFASFAELPSGVEVVVTEEDAGAVRSLLLEAGLAFSETLEEPRDYVAEAAALQRPVAVGRFLLDPHDDAAGAGAPEKRRRLHVPARRAFGTGSHESTRLALRLLLAEPLRGKTVLDVGCGAGPLALCAAEEGARVVAFDIDPDAPVATRENALANGVILTGTYAGPFEALSRKARFDVAVANMIQEEVAPLLPALRGVLGERGRLVCAGQLLAREEEWRALVSGHGFALTRLAAEGEWLGSTWEAA